ncbi:hypothetical protein SPW_1358 [Streptomyces sp. W007]|nr:hypothetical protein SPW_1358 [Streptomyces sp. W007]
MDGPWRVGVLAAVEAGVENGRARFVDRGGAQSGVPLALDPLPVRAPLADREGGPRLQDEPVVLASLESEVPPADVLLLRQGAMQGGADAERPVGLRVPLPRFAQEEVPAPLGERQHPAGPLDGGGREHGPEVVAVSSLQAEDRLLPVAAVPQDELPEGARGLGEDAFEDQLARLSPGEGGDDGLDGPVGEHEVARGVGGRVQLPAAGQCVASVLAVGPGRHRQRLSLTDELDAPDVVLPPEGAERDVRGAGAGRAAQGELPGLLGAPLGEPEGDRSGVAEDLHLQAHGVLDRRLPGQEGGDAFGAQLQLVAGEDGDDAGPLVGVRHGGRGRGADEPHRAPARPARADDDGLQLPGRAAAAARALRREPARVDDGLEPGAVVAVQGVAGEGGGPVARDRAGPQGDQPLPGAQPAEPDRAARGVPYVGVAGQTQQSVPPDGFGEVRVDGQVGGGQCGRGGRQGGRGRRGGGRGGGAVR